MGNLILYASGIAIVLLVFYLMCEIYFYTRQRYIERTLAPLIKEIYRGKANSTLSVSATRPSGCEK